MIYFLVNNDYQLYDARRHLAAFAAQGMSAALIEVPHTLRSPDRGAGFAATYSFRTPMNSGSWLAAWPRYWMAGREVRRSLRPGSDDVLLLFTEYELLNHVIARHFKSAGARVYLMEDGGMGTYLPFSVRGDEPLTGREKVRAAMVRCIPGLASTRFHKANDIVFPWLHDSQLDGLCVYRSIDCVRTIPNFLIVDPPQAPVERESGRVLFLNERIYDYYQTESQYLEGLDRILAGLRRGFAQVYFKFHPTETPAWGAKIRALLAARHPDVEIIEETAAVENIIERYRPEALASYFCAALLTLWGRGIEPLYLYHLFDEMASQKFFGQMTAILARWSYVFPTSLEELRSGYVSGLNFDQGGARIALAELVGAPANKSVVN